MDILKDKAVHARDYLSRYASFPYYYNMEDKKYMQGLTAQLSLSTTHTAVPVSESTTLDKLALQYYGRPDYWWVIADFNRIQDPFIKLVDYFSMINIPSLSSIEYEERTS